MFKILNQRISENGYTLISEYSKDGVSVSHTEEVSNGAYHLKVSTDKVSILNDGVDTATIKAEVFNYLDEFQSTATPEITFSLDGQEQVVTAVDGVATITFSSSQAGNYTFVASSPDYRSGEVTINVKA